MARHISVGIDIGNHSVKVAIAEELKDGERIVHRIIGTGRAETRGLDKGFIVNPSEVSRSVRQAVEKAEKSAGVVVKRAFVSAGGISLDSFLSNGSVAVSRGDLEVTSIDVDNAIEAAEKSIPESHTLNRKVINTVPLETKLDGRVIPARVEGMKGGKLEVKTLFITCLEHHLEDLVRSVEGAGVEVVDVVAGPVASSFVILSKKHKRAGCLLLNIGSETTSLVVFENTNPLSLEVFEIGGNDITHDIALKLKTTIEEAESIKLGSMTRTEYPKKKLDDAISGKLGEIFKLVDLHLKKIGRQELLPAGIVITGGGGAISGIKDFAEHYLKLPARVGSIHFGDEERTSNKDLPWSTAFGLALVGFNADNERNVLGQKGLSSLAEGGKKGLEKISNWFSKFLP